MSTNSQARRVTPARAAALLAILAWVLVAPEPASAQLGSLIVNITSPASGVTVSGTIAVNASVTIIGALTVQRVEFYVDGNFIDSDPSGPSYSVLWNTRTVGNGSRTLTAVGRDILGVGWSSSPVTVTVANDTTPPSVNINQAATQADPASSAPINFTVVFSEPVSGFTGSGVAITGTAGGAKTVTVSGSGSSYTAAVSGMTTSGTVVATIAAGVATDAAGNGNTASTSTDNTVTFNASTSPPTITSFTPTSGPVGTTVTISGTNFTDATAVTFNGVSATFMVRSATTIEATVPGGATTGAIGVTTPGGTATSASGFTVVSQTAAATRVENPDPSILFKPGTTDVDRPH